MYGFFLQLSVFLDKTIQATPAALWVELFFFNVKNECHIIIVFLKQQERFRIRVIDSSGFNRNQKNKDQN